MASELAIIDIIRNDSAVGELVGGNGTNARVYPLDVPQKATFPAIVVSMEDIEPYDTKDGVSTLDVEYIKVECMDTTYKNTTKESGSWHIGEAVRAALDRTTGTYSNIVCQSIRFDSSSMFTEDINNKVIYVNEQIYKVRVER